MWTNKASLIVNILLPDGLKFEDIYEFIDPMEEESIGYIRENICTKKLKIALDKYPNSKWSLVSIENTQGIVIGASIIVHKKIDER